VFYLPFQKKVIPSILFHHEALPFKKSFCSLGRVLRATTIKTNHTGYELRPGFGSQAYDHKLSAAGRYP
jgi:hypothetical protein